MTTVMNETPLTTKTKANNNGDDNIWRRSHSRRGFGLWCMMVNSMRWFKLVVVVVVTDGYRPDGDEHPNNAAARTTQRAARTTMVKSRLWSRIRF